LAGADGTGHEEIVGQRIEWYSTESADIDRSAVNVLEARDATLTRGIVNQLRAEDADIAQSAIGMAAVDRATIRESTAGAIVGRSVACDEVRVGVLASPVVRGEVHTWLDLRAAVAIGVGIAFGKLIIAAAGAIIRRAAR
jgi:hypothetical protein